MSDVSIRARGPGTRRFGGIAGRLRGGRGFLAAIGALWSVGIAAYFFVALVDPYELRSEKNAVRLAEHPYPLKIVPRLLSVATRSADLVLVGSSTSMGYTPTMLRQAFVGVQRPANLSFPCAGSDFFEPALKRLAVSPGLKRAIVNLDATFIDKCGGGIGNLMDARYLQAPWHQPVPDFGLEGIELSWRALKTGVLDRPAWAPAVADRVEGTEDDAPAVSDSGVAMAQLRDAAKTTRGRIATFDLPACGSFPALDRFVVPFARRMAERGVPVDFIAPPYSLSAYSFVDTLDFADREKADFFSSVMGLRLCLLQAVQGMGGVRMHAFDADFSVTDNLANYRDPIHLAHYASYKDIAARVAAGSDVLTLGKWPSYVSALRAAVVAYRP